MNGNIKLVVGVLITIALGLGAYNLQSTISAQYSVGRLQSAEVYNREDIKELKADMKQVLQSLAEIKSEIKKKETAQLIK